MVFCTCSHKNRRFDLLRLSFLTFLRFSGSCHLRLINLTQLIDFFKYITIFHLYLLGMRYIFTTPFGLTFSNVFNKLSVLQIFIPS